MENSDTHNWWRKRPYNAFLYFLYAVSLMKATLSVQRIHKYLVSLTLIVCINEVSLRSCNDASNGRIITLNGTSWTSSIPALCMLLYRPFLCDRNWAWTFLKCIIATTTVIITNVTTGELMENCLSWSFTKILWYLSYQQVIVVSSHRAVWWRRYDVDVAIVMG